MTLTLAVILGLLVGYRFGLKKKAALIIGAFLMVMALAQASFYIAVNDTTDLSYWTAILVLITFSSIWVGSKLRTRSSTI
jgi:hypothetical protein